MTMKATNHMTWEEFQAWKESSGIAPTSSRKSVSTPSSPKRKASSPRTKPRTQTTPHQPGKTIPCAPSKTKAQQAGWVAKATWYDSPMVGFIKFRSTKEAKRAKALDDLVTAGEITAWWYETPLYCGFENDDGSPVRMFPDFKILWADGRVTYQDVKPGGKRRPEKDWTLRRKAVRKHLGIDVEIIT